MNALDGKQWLLFVALGLASIILGAIAWMDAISVTLASAMFLGVLVMIAGAVQVFHAFAIKASGGFLFSLLLGIAYLLGGALLIEEPATGSVIITIFIAMCMVVAGTVRAIVAFQNRGVPGWWVVLFGGLVSLVVGIMLYATLPWSGLWLVGTLIAVELIIAGVGWIQFGLALRRGTTEVGTGF
ncbi:HdeD family acid-resistance protein [Acetobacter fallax]|uniref:HdeD family acid-resistance protein n=1 Tax=Acetobacter fallax TaxID=1737473 RepID=A0ABX0KAP8_9PROT|nr:HdeD family acid-resistance protein [Acetobacter fallax]NHO32504.1 HdeD family acid-resistance protein [Acetobacter fallax]NHO36064.1 HdeD family acid-resistance protein [Acetobacter fallax]